MVYVGNGGNYDAQMEYQYVGHGQGQYDVKRGHNWCWVFPAMCCALLALLCAWWWWCEEAPLPPFDCNVDFHDWEIHWGRAKQEYCCQLENRGCHHSTTPPTTTPEPHHCGWGLGQWETLWSEEKKTWCCEHQGRGCVQPPTTTEAPWTCDDDPNWADTWPEKKQEWCCDHYGKGCLIPDYDCEEIFADWLKDWSYSMRYWCCNHCTLVDLTCHTRKCLPFKHHPF